MTRLIDLTMTLDPANRAKLPPPLAGAAKVVTPAIEYLYPAEQKGRSRAGACAGSSRYVQASSWDVLPRGRWDGQRSSDSSV